MTSSDSNNELVTSQEKLEWVTPKISLMDAVDTEGKFVRNIAETTIVLSYSRIVSGPS